MMHVVVAEDRVEESSFPNGCCDALICHARNHELTGKDAESMSRDS
jgi:hypothetical protein